MIEITFDKEQLESMLKGCVIEDIVDGKMVKYKLRK